MLCPDTCSAIAGPYASTSALQASLLPPTKIRLHSDAQHQGFLWVPDKAMWQCIVPDDADTAGTAADATANATASTLPARVLSRADWRLPAGSRWCS
jgi:hypothetical protein